MSDVPDMRKQLIIEKKNRDGVNIKTFIKDHPDQIAIVFHTL